MVLKVVIENAILRGSSQESVQKVATVYCDGEEYRVVVPSRATGDAIEWLELFSVRRLSKQDFGSESIITDDRGPFIISQVVEQLKHKRAEHPDAPYYHAQICLQGHVQSSGGKVDFKGESIVHGAAIRASTVADTAKLPFVGNICTLPPTTCAHRFATSVAANTLVWKTVYKLRRTCSIMKISYRSKIGRNYGTCCSM